MNKLSVVQKIKSSLESQLELAKGASAEAAEYATHEESKADSKWDTQGLEASYLAAGQAAQVLEIGRVIQVVTGYLEAIEEKHVRVEAGVLFSLSMSGMENWFFLAGSGGGVSVDEDGTTVTVITPQSPIAHRVIGRSVGKAVMLPNGSEAVVTNVM